MLVTYSGRKSGKTFTVPVNYMRDGDTLYVLSFRKRSWWRNFKDGYRATLRLRGEDVAATGTAIHEPDETVEALNWYVQKNPGFARLMAVKLDENKQPIPETVEVSAQERVVIRFDL
jgi:deazaflavin-dependent oxidoreductase (nitroreductase family)